MASYPRAGKDEQRRVQEDMPKSPQSGTSKYAKQLTRRWVEVSSRDSLHKVNPEDLVCAYILHFPSCIFPSPHCYTFYSMSKKGVSEDELVEFLTVKTRFKVEKRASRGQK